MSGPKVVNLEALRRRRQRDSLVRMRELRDTVAEWHAALERAGRLSDTQAAEAEAMFARLENLRTGEQWQALSKEIAVRRASLQGATTEAQQLRETVAEWRTASERTGLPKGQVAEVEAMFVRLENLRAGEQWEPLFAEIAARRAFLRDATAQAQQASLDKVTTRRERRRRLDVGIAMLRRELAAAGLPASPEFEALAELGDTTDELALSRGELILQQALNALPGPEKGSAAGAAQQELAKALQSPDNELRTLPDWLAAHGENAAQLAQNDRLARALAELELQAPTGQATALFAKARLITQEPSAERRTVLTDSVLLEADELCRALRETRKANELLQEALATLEPFQSAEAEAWRQRLTAAATNPSAPAIRQLTRAAQDWCTAEAAREDAAARRAAVLQALGELGYEVRDGMATAWAENGRVVVRKPSETNYGVELSSAAAGTSVQARVVAFGDAQRSSQNAERDREVEHTWCADFQRMRSLMEAEGFAPTLVHATPAGQAPLKVVPSSEGECRDARDVATPQARQRRPESER